MFTLPFKEASERFLLLRLHPEGTSAALFSINPERQIKTEHFWPSLELLTPWPWFRRYRFSKILVAVHPYLTYTVQLPLLLSREEVLSTQELTPAELENLLAKSVSQKFVSLRDEASRALGLDSVDTILADSRVGAFKVDGHRVLNPVGFVPREIQTTVELSFINRNLFSAVKHFLKNAPFSFSDLARAEISALRHIEPAAFSLIMLDAPRTLSFVSEPTASGYRAERGVFPWRQGQLEEAVSGLLHLEPSLAKKVYLAYLKRSFSERLNKVFATLFKKSLIDLEGVLAKVRLKGKVFLIGARLPDWPKIKEKGFLSSVPVMPLLERAGFSFVPDQKIAGEEQFEYLAPLLEYFSSQGNVEVSRWLRRRLHWLGSVEYN